MMRKLGIAAAAVTFALFGMPFTLAAQDVPPPSGTVLDGIIAHVNDEIITSHEYEQQKEGLTDEIKQAHPDWTQQQIDAEYQVEAKELLGNMISQDLLVERAEDDGINVDADLVKYLDQQRLDYKLPSLDALQRAVEASGLDWDDYKETIKRRLLARQVIEQDVGGTVQIGNGEIAKYYQDHKSKFDRPETVVIREIFLSTKDKTPAQAALVKKKIDAIREQLVNGQDFGQLAKLYSQGPTAQDGGELGSFTRDQLRPDVADEVFKLQHNQFTPIIDMGNGYDIFQVEQHYQAGIQPLDAVRQEIENAIYMQKMQPAAQKFLETLRKQSYIQIAPGYSDYMAVPETALEEVAPGSDTDTNKKGKKKKSR